MKKWEYKSIQVSDAGSFIIDFLNKEGKNGWEAIAFVPRKNSIAVTWYYVVFKREILN